MNKTIKFVTHLNKLSLFPPLSNPSLFPLLDYLSKSPSADLSNNKLAACS